jgi:hypothetical protein
VAKILKNYRLNEKIIEKLEELQVVSDKTATDLVEAAINYVHEEYARAIKGKDNDACMLAQVLGMRIDKAS